MVRRSGPRLARRGSTTTSTLALALAVGLVLAPLAPAHAQRTFRTVGRDLGSAVTDVWWILTSPVRGDARDWLGAAAVVGTTVAIGAADERIHLYVLEQENRGLLRLVEPVRENGTADLASIPTSRRLLPLNGALYLAGFVADNPKLRDAGMGCFAAQQASSQIRHGLYAVVARTRPLQAKGDPYDFEVPGGEWEEHSFFGGHVANAVACATYFNSRFELGVVEPVLYAFAAGIGVARMVDQRHWASDTFLGSAVGWAIGRSIAARQKHRMARRERGGSSTVVEEQEGGGFYVTQPPGGLVVGWRRSF